jgi:hypothetical protein
MADEREGQEIDPRRAAKEGRLQTPGRRENAAQPLSAAKDNAGADRYPDADDPRSFEPKTRNETAPTSPNEGRIGPASDPAEGKR